MSTRRWRSSAACSRPTIRTCRRPTRYSCLPLDSPARAAHAHRRGVTVAGLHLSYLEWGLASPGTISFVCLHGLLATAESFDPLAAHFGPKQHVVSLDLPGNGGSEHRSDMDASFVGLAFLVRQFTEALRLERYLLLGHSHGGAIVLQLAVTSPDLSPLGLVLLCPAHPFSGQEEPVVRFYLTSFGRAIAHLLPYLPLRLQVFGFQQMMAPGTLIDPARPALYTENLRRRGTVSHVLHLLRSWQTDMKRLREDLRKRPIRVPVLLLWGAQDWVVPAGTAEALEAHLAAARLVVLPNVGHLPTEEAPSECARQIREWQQTYGLH